MLTGTPPGVVLANGTLTVTGTSAADTIDVLIGNGDTGNPEPIIVTLNGARQTFNPTPSAPIAHVVVNAGEGNDNVTVEDYPTDSATAGTADPDVSISGGAGDDSIAYTNEGANDRPTLDGGDGNDVLYVATEGGQQGTPYYTEIGDAGNDTLIAGDADDTAYVGMSGGDGDDTFEVEDFDDAVAIGGGAGTDTLQLSEDTDPSGQPTTIDMDSPVTAAVTPDMAAAGGQYTVEGDVENVTGRFSGAALTVNGNALNNDINVDMTDEGTATFNGGDGNDTLGVEEASSATISGGTGNDALLPDFGGGPVAFSGGAGTDVVDYSAYPTALTVYLDGSQPGSNGDTFDGTVEQVYGTAYNDVLYGTAGNNALFGNGGNDTIHTMGGTDAVFGGDGNDTVYANDGGPTYVDGGAGTDTAYVDPTGDTTANVEDVVKEAPPVILANGVLTVTGTPAADAITVDVHAADRPGDPQSVDVTLNGTTQTVTGVIGEVIVNAGDGNDTVNVDSVSSDDGAPAVSVSGGEGDDHLSFDIGDGQVTLDGGDGNDTLYAAGEDTAHVTMLGGAGDDTITADLDAQASISGGDGNDTIDLGGAYRPVTVSGGAGTDTLNVDPDGPGNAAINLDGRADSTLDQSAATIDTDVENVNVQGVEGTEAVTGDAAANVITVDDSSSVGTTVHGGDGNDTIDVFGENPASVFGDAGNDTLAGGGGVHLSGGAGTDTVDYSAAASGVTVHLDGSAASGTAQQLANGVADTFDGTVEDVIGSPYADAIYTDGGAESVYAGAGNDTVYADDGGPTYVDGGAGTDTAYVDAAGDTTVRVENVIHPTPAVHQLTGTTIGTAGSYANQGNTIAKATDGNLGTYFDAPTASGAYVGVDLGSTQVVSQIRFAPRTGHADRMVGGVFQASTSATFANAVTVYTVTSLPAQGVLTTVNVSAGSGFRYWRYVGPAGGYCNVAEFQLDGTGTTTPTATRLSGTTIGTAGSYQNQGNKIAKATDGNLNTFFDAPTASGSYVGLDLGAAHVVTQIGFAPRSGYASRMVGGYFQASSTADFANAVTVYTVTAAPASGQVTSVAVSAGAAYRYWRYVGPANSNCNIAEFQLFGY